MRLCVCRTLADVFEAIRSLRVRGAPAIGLAAAYGVVLGLQDSCAGDTQQFARSLDQVIDYLGSSRPTAINLFWALERLRSCARQRLATDPPVDVHAALLREATAMHAEDRAICHAIGRQGAALLRDGMGVLTHCNAGGLAASEYGTALAVIYAAQDAGKHLTVYADETRPLLQGARLTTWELRQRGVDTTLICDSMAAQVMREGRVQAVITGADRIAANGDVANKIGTYGVAVLAQAHRLPFYVAAPSSTFDLTLSGGEQIPIEQRGEEEVRSGLGRQIAPDDVKIYNPAFDVTPARLVTALITERGVISPVNATEIRRVLDTPADPAE
jgi:methylthioribose-1-phosphate isomerase